jgi:hypothetical protein
MAVTVKQQMESGQYTAAYKTWVDLLDLIDTKSGNIVSVTLHNTLLLQGAGTQKW